MRFLSWSEVPCRCGPMRAVITLAVLAILAIHPTFATASRVQVYHERLVYRAAAAETNVLRITGGVRAFIVRDSGASIEAGSRCHVVTPNQAQCRVDAVLLIDVSTADLDDTVFLDATPLPGRILGGPGNDRLVGGRGPDQIYGSAGDDAVIGRDGEDIFRGGPGADRLDAGGGSDVVSGQSGDDQLDGGPGADRLAGGPGYDVARYATRSAPLQVTVDDVPDDGEAGEADNVAPTVERVDGGQGNDTLVARQPSSPGLRGTELRGNGGNDTLLGGSGADFLRGGPGTDTLDGAAGPDLVFGGADPDILRGGGGADQIGASDQFHDDIDCGDGSDAATLDRQDDSAMACENDQRGGPGAGSGSGTIGGLLLAPAKARLKTVRGRRVAQVLLRSRVRSHLEVWVTLKSRGGRELRRVHRDVRTNHWRTVPQLHVPRRASVVSVGA
jgi:Ca2+-binding RTX toxin-like protein